MGFVWYDMIGVVRYIRVPCLGGVVWLVGWLVGMYDIKSGGLEGVLEEGFKLLEEVVFSGVVWRGMIPVL